MRCNEARDLLSEYLDGTLPIAQIEQVRHHLSECSVCREEYEELSETLNLIHSMPRQEPVFEIWQEFAPKFAEIHAEMRMGPLRFYFSRVYNAVKEGWVIFISALQMNSNREFDRS